MRPTDYKKLLNDNVTKDYKRDRQDRLRQINRDIGKHAKNLKLEDRMEVHSEKNAFVTVKDHKEGYKHNPKCRLINPASNQLGKASKRILEEAVRDIRRKSGLHQWGSTGEMLKWFKRRHEEDSRPSKSTLIQFDICEFYPSISEELMEKALEYAKRHTKITDDHIQIIRDCRRSILFNGGKAWTKKGKDFDITMGASDGAEASDLVGLYLLQQVQTLLDKNFDGCKGGLYRDDGLIYVNDSNGPKETRITKELHRLFKGNGLKITVEQIGPIVDILDVTLSSREGTYKPYRKPNSTIAYVNSASNHPPKVLKNIPVMIERRISSISSSKKEFDEAKGEYKEALEKAGYKSEMVYQGQEVVGKDRKRKRRRKKNVIWYNPPFSKNVKTNIGKVFFGLLQRNFPPKHPLHCLFNKKTVSLAYSTMPNMDAIVKAHNKGVLRKEEEKGGEEGELCNCRKKEKCPVNKKCMTEGVVYKAKVEYEGKEATYIGMTGDTFKKRWNRHKTDFRYDKYRHETELSKFIWKLKDRQIQYRLTWQIIAKALTYKPGSITCNLCLMEKYSILTTRNILNKKSEMLNKCVHKRQFLAVLMKEQNVDVQQENTLED